MEGSPQDKLNDPPRKPATPHRAPPQTLLTGVGRQIATTCAALWRAPHEMAVSGTGDDRCRSSVGVRQGACCRRGGFGAGIATARHYTGVRGPARLMGKRQVVRWHLVSTWFAWQQGPDRTCEGPTKTAFPVWGLVPKARRATNVAENLPESVEGLLGRNGLVGPRCSVIGGC